MQDPSAAQLKRQQLCCPHLPLAIYREVVAHLRQVEGVNADLLPQTARSFDYRQSQVGGLWVDAASDLAQRRIEQILSYYADRYGPWTAIPDSSH